MPAVRSAQSHAKGKVICIWVMIIGFFVTVFAACHSVLVKASTKFPRLVCDYAFNLSVGEDQRELKREREHQLFMEADPSSTTLSWLGELEQKVNVLLSKPLEMPLEKEKLLNAALSRVNALEGELIATKKVSWKVTYNGHEMNEFEPQRTATYISQHDVHIGELSVRETLSYSARFQGVGDCYGEMLVGPVKVLFMDEISTGLDSSTTFQIVNSLGQYVHILDGTAVISLLQPAPETYDIFDDIILQSDGLIVYQGPRESVLEFFEEMGFRCPKRKRVSYFLQEVSFKLPT